MGQCRCFFCLFVHVIFGCTCSHNTFPSLALLFLSWDLTYIHALSSKGQGQNPRSLYSVPTVLFFFAKSVNCQLVSLLVLYKNSAMPSPLKIICLIMVQTKGTSSVLCTLYSVLCAVCSVLWCVCSVLCAVCCACCGAPEAPIHQEPI